MKFKKLIQTVISAALSLTLAISSCPMDDVFCSWSTVFTGDKTTQPNEDDTAYSLGTLNGAKICAFVYGMAAHIAADIFAHSSYIDVNGTYTRIKHVKVYNTSKYDADNEDYIPNRFECAGELVNKVVNHYYTSGSNRRTAGSVSDFILTKYDNSTFKLHYLTTYIQQVGGTSVYNSAKTYFDTLNTSTSTW